MQRDDLAALISDTIRIAKLVPMTDTRLSRIAGAAIAEAIIERYIVIEDTQVYIPPPEKRMTQLTADQAARIRQIIVEN
jgi:hypothetical protein